MRTDLIGRNSAYNSMIFMGVDGGAKQLGAVLLTMSPIVIHYSSSANLLLIIAGSTLISACYTLIRKRIFTVVV